MNLRQYAGEKLLTWNYNQEFNNICFEEIKTLKLVDLLTKADPWQGEDCGRQNCLFCSNKTLTGKNLSQDCRKRNVEYETWCISCQERDQKKLEEEIKDEKTLKEAIRNMRLHKYLGESHRSPYERGWEHLNDLTGISSDSHMVKHLVNNHEEDDFEDVKFGMKVIQYSTSSFTRQIKEGVMIQKERKKHDILNSRSEFNRCSLPRLSTRLGEKDGGELEREMKEIKDEDDLLEKKIREFRKSKSKARLLPSREEPARKRRKLEKGEEDRVSVRKVWMTEAKSEKRGSEEESDTGEKRTSAKRLKREERSSNRDIPETIEEEEEEIDSGEDSATWEEKLEEHRKELERRAEERNEEEKQIQDTGASWDLMTLCRDFLETSSKDWEREKVKREKKEKKQERLSLGRQKKQELRERLLKREITETEKLLPREVREKMEMEEARKRRLDLKRMKDIMWKKHRGDELENYLRMRRERMQSRKQRKRRSKRTSQRRATKKLGKRKRRS